MLESIVDVWKIVIKIENSNDLMAMLVEGPSRKIIFDVLMNHIIENEGDFWSKVCFSCGSRSRDILRKLIFVVVNCFLANIVKKLQFTTYCQRYRKTKIQKIQKLGTVFP